MAFLSRIFIWTLLSLVGSFASLPLTKAAVYPCGLRMLDTFSLSRFSDLRFVPFSKKGVVPLKDLPQSDFAEVDFQINQLASAPYNLDLMRATDFQNGLNQVAFSDDGKVIGYVLAHKASPSDQSVSILIEGMAVSSEAASLGIDRQLMRALALRAQKLEIPEIQFYEIKTSTPSHDFYTPLGFKHESSPRENSWYYVVPTLLLIQKTSAR